MRAVATTLIVVVLLFGGRLTGQTVRYNTPQTFTEGALLSFFVEVAGRSQGEFTLRDADGGVVGSAVNKSVLPMEPWLDKVRLSRPVSAGSTLQVGITTMPRVGSRYGVSMNGFQVGIVNGERRVQGAGAPIIREPVQCTSQVCDVCYTLDQNVKVVFDSYTVKRAIVKPDFHPNAPSVKGTHVARWQWPVDAQRGDHFVVATSQSDNTATESNSFILPPGPPPTNCP